MQPSRRDTFRVGLVGVAAIGLGGACGVAKPRVVANDRVIPDEVIGSKDYGLSLATFAPHVGSAFRFAAADGGAGTELTLTSATDLGISGRPIVDKAECFSLSFAANAASTRAAALSQDTYLVSHAKVGAFSLFIVPASQSGAVSYTALFNRV